MDNHSVRARSFGRQAALYQRLRPGYPAQAIATFLPERGKRVVDVGAGTGKLSAALAGAGHDVIAVEPDAQMRATLAEHVAGIDARDGTGEALPVADGSADAVCYGQSWHWVEPQAAAREARRVLTGDGVLAMLWNVPDIRVPWVREMVAITHPGQNPLIGDEPVITGFGAGVLERVTWQQRLSAEEIIDLVGTWSRIATSPPAERDALLDAVRDVLSTHPDLRGRAEIEIPYLCRVYHYRVR